MDGKGNTEYEENDFELDNLEEMQPDVPWELELKKSSEKLQKLSFNQLTERLEAVVENVKQFGERSTKKTEQSTFLANATNEFELDIIESLENLRVVTNEDQLEALT
jgi:hypothetical protein